MGLGLTGGASNGLVVEVEFEGGLGKFVVAGLSPRFADDLHTFGLKFGDGRALHVAPIEIHPSEFQALLIESINERAFLERAKKADAPLPSFVTDELTAFLRCGLR